jgi:ribose transport system permease protein
MPDTHAATDNPQHTAPAASDDPLIQNRMSPDSGGKRGREVQWSAYLGILIFVVVIVIFSIWIPDRFLTASNWQSIAQTGAITAILALGLLVPLSAGVYDLSCAQCLGFTALVCSWLMTQGPHLSVPLAIVVTLIVGLFVGLFNGFLVAIVGLDSFIATLGTTSLLLAGCVYIANGQYLGPFSSSFASLTSGKILGIPTICLYLLVLALLVWYLLEHTPLGRRVQATGANADAARLAGLRTRRLIFWSMVVCAVVASMAGILYASVIGTTNQNDGPPYLLPAFTAAFLGATFLKPGIFNVWGTVIAVYLLGTGVQGLQLVGGQIWIVTAFNGAALLIAVSSAVISERFRGEHAVSRMLRRLSPAHGRDAPTSAGDTGGPSDH